MKRLCTLLLALTLLTTAALADVLIEPNDDFYASHRGECEYLYRQYTANGEKGYVILYESPKSSRERENVANGEVLLSLWSYQGAWLAIQGERDDIRGWVELADCVPVPDYLSFQDHHGEEFVPFDGAAYDHAFDGLEKVVLWSYPGTDQEGQEVSAEWFQDSNRDMRELFDSCWEDGQGRMWGFVGYCYGIRNTWLCLSDPANLALEADPTVIPQDDHQYPAISILPAPSSGVSGLTMGLVALVVVATAGLIPMVFRRKKGSQNPL